MSFDCVGMNPDIPREFVEIDLVGDGISDANSLTGVVERENRVMADPKLKVV